MKSIILGLALFLSSTSFAQSTRELCENASYATDYVKLHQYKIVIDWSYVSDYAHNDLEDILFSGLFEILSQDDSKWPIEILTIKENGSRTAFDYQKLLEVLKNIPTKVSCKYNY